MSVFNDLIRIDDSEKITYNNLIEWDHFLIANKPEFSRNLMALFSHCLICTALDGCYVTKVKSATQHHLEDG